MKKSNDTSCNRFKDNSYFSISRQKSSKQIPKFGIPAVIAMVMFAVFITMQAQEQGIGADIVSHFLHPTYYN